MTDVNVQWMKCARKRAFGSRKSAKGRATGLRKVHGSIMGVYKCEHCGQFHLFDEKKRDRARERKRAAA